MTGRGDARATPLAAVPLVLLVRLYQVTLSPFLGGACRFQPTCSNYALEALRTHGALRGSWLAARRIGRCRPGGGAGWDPVPPAGAAAPAERRGAAVDDAEPPG